MTKLDINSIQKIFQKRAPNSHKGNHGHALIIAGSKSKIGAAIICAKACLRSGAGLVTLNIPKKERIALFSSVPEAMTEFREREKELTSFNSFAIGPGIGTNKSATNLLRLLITNVKIPTVFDADALNILAKNQHELLNLPQKSILTPHVKEVDRLFGKHDSESERRITASTKAKELHLIIILKGHKSFITDGEKSFENTTEIQAWPKAVRAML
ncbi:NAD(P)H-hydrate dehydratase [Flavobacterium paronense]|uniref:NAD(P)H-hydrate dehydratase n=1 Tax=Flavobacterium paronense TaxID=1392775 RepID=UPI0025B3F6AE|nr:NAD(P)H-hydrate dehydratase [Flavobacterium paronense]MDN3678660.1 NAD(P)H-hydrate dehydratase [Flavobacterium paronense]